MTFDWVKMAQTAVVPVVIISACGLLCLALYNRLAAIVSRLRSFERERIEILVAEAHAAREGTATPEREVEYDALRASLEEQIRRILHRAEYLRRALLCLLGGIWAEALCSLLSGLSTIWPPLTAVAAVCYVAGMLLVLSGLTQAMAEMRQALESAVLESRAVDALALRLKTLVDDAGTV